MSQMDQLDSLDSSFSGLPADTLNVETVVAKPIEKKIVKTK